MRGAQGGAALQANLASVVRNRGSPTWFATCRFSPDPCSLGSRAIHRLFDDLEFRVLRDRLFGTR